ncbi:MAG: hypothetical protein LBC61_07510 [Candidatus Peribacteria bacterium]|jgi:hypothetical protein|nr:hypothetical protein [Candidatus Peribacteria bacterium]
MVMESNLIKVLNKEKQELNILNNLFLDLPKLRQKIFFRNDILFKIM